MDWHFYDSWILYCWCRACKEGWSLKVCVQMGIAMGLCMLSYYNAYGYLLMSAVVLQVHDEMWRAEMGLAAAAKERCLMLGIVFLVADGGLSVVESCMTEIFWE